MSVHYLDSVNGDDNNDGLSEFFPFKTPSKANALNLTGSDQVLSKAGSTFTTPFFISFRNATTVPFILGKYGEGPDPVIDLNDRFNANAVGINIYTCGAARIQDFNIKRCGFGIQQSMDPIATVMGGFEVYDCEVSECGGDLIRAGLGATASVGGSYKIGRINGHDANNDGIAFFGALGFEVFSSRFERIAVGTGNDPINATSGDAITSHDVASGYNFHHIIVKDAHEGFHCVNEGTGSVNLIHEVYVSQVQGAPIRIEAVGANVGTWRIFNSVLLADDIHADGISCIHVGDSGSGNIFDLSVYNCYLRQKKSGKYGLLFISRNQASAAGAVRFRNNAFVMSAGAKAVSYDNPHATLGGLTTKVATKNTYHRPTDLATAFHWDGTDTDFAGWKTASGIDADSQAADPLVIADPVTEVADAKPTAASPLLGFGDNLTGLGVSGLSLDYDGRQRAASGAWDAGPFNRRSETHVYLAAQRMIEVGRRKPPVK